ncbi:hypothetical protein V5F77_04375 [Xanthobacter sp. DSM 24535]|uniref:phage adaptor protein n=1 Tax=Roseixanthobacter psychrophilus TaxID=3119917 RepID=UPI0037297F95
MITFDAFMPLVLPYATACPEPLAEASIRNSAIEFCERTRCWRLLDDTVIDADTPDVIAVSTPAGSALHRIETAWFDGRKIDPASFASVPQDDDDQRGSPRTYSQSNFGELRLFPRPDAGKLRLSLFLKPDRASDEVPDFLHQQFGQEIAYGALVQILLTPSQPFSDPQMAAYYKSRFDAACDKNFAISITGQQRARPRTRASFV